MKRAIPLMRKKRRYVRRRTSRSKYITSTAGTASGSLYRTRRLSYRLYRRRLYENLRFQEKYRSVFSGPATITDTATAADKKLWYSYTIPDNFYLTAGGFTGTQTFATSKFIIKGGQLYVNYRNDTTDTITVEWGVVRYRNSTAEAEINGNETEVTFDISNFASFGTGFKLYQRMRRVSVEPNGTIEMRCRIPFTVINDLDQWSTEGYGKYAIITTIFPNSTTALSVPRVLGHNLTFVADAIAET